MMADRKSFLASLGIASVFLASGRPAAAQSESAVPSASPQAPSPVPSSKAAKATGAAAVAFAATMRRFDPKLTDADLATIAKQIDENAGVGSALNPKKRRLANGDGPVTTFAAGKR